jgi:hypothetical protein
MSGDRSNNIEDSVDTSGSDFDNLTKKMKGIYQVQLLCQKKRTVREEELNGLPGEQIICVKVKTISDPATTILIETYCACSLCIIETTEAMNNSTPCHSEGRVLLLPQCPIQDWQ